MPVKNLISAFRPPPPDEVRRVAGGLQYRDFLTVGVLVRKMNTENGVVPDNWIYIQEPGIVMGRLQVFNNWSKYMVADPSGTVWLGCEYFANESDTLYQSPDSEIIELAVSELTELGLIEGDVVLDGVVLRMPKAYPAYFGTYGEFDAIRRFTDSFENLFLIGRNGMHKYNNQDHSMLAAMTAVDLIQAGSTDKSPIWEVNAEDEYHETKS